MSDEKEIACFQTGLVIVDELFHSQQHLTEHELLPVIHSLVKQCEGMIKEAGIYGFYLRVVKIK